MLSIYASSSFTNALDHHFHDLNILSDSLPILILLISLPSHVPHGLANREHLAVAFTTNFSH